MVLTGDEFFSLINDRVNATILTLIIQFLQDQYRKKRQTF